MALNLDKFEKDLDALLDRGRELGLSMYRDAYGVEAMREAHKEFSDDDFKAAMKALPPFRVSYEAWYSESIAVLKQILPDRVADFKRQYERQKGRKQIDYETYMIEDFLLDLQVKSVGEVVVDKKAAIPKFQNQKAILNAAKGRFKSSLFEIRQLVQADLFDDEILSARELHKSKFYRAAGAIAGVVLEKHLAQVCSDHNVKIIKKNPAIGDLNEALKAAGSIDVPQWRYITMLGDIRNICDHNKQKEPTSDQVNDLINGVDKVMKTII